MSNRKTKTIAKQSGSVGVFWDKLRGGETSLIGEHIPKMQVDKEAVDSLTTSLTDWFKPDHNETKTVNFLRKDKFKLNDKSRQLLSEFLDTPGTDEHKTSTKNSPAKAPK
jgi:hypothetical protein